MTEPVDLVIEYSLDRGETWRHGRTVPAWVGDDPAAKALQRDAVREQAIKDHGDTGTILTRVLREDDPRGVLNQPPGPGPGGWLAAFGAGFTQTPVTFQGTIGDFLAAADEARLGQAADDAASGVHPVAVVHGDPEPDANARAMFEDLPRLAEECGHVVSRMGGNDYSVYRFGGPGAEQAAARFAAAAVSLAVREGLTWWKVTMTGWPEFGRG